MGLILLFSSTSIFSYYSLLNEPTEKILPTPYTKKLDIAPHFIRYFWDSPPCGGERIMEIGWYVWFLIKNRGKIKIIIIKPCVNPSINPVSKNIECTYHPSTLTTSGFFLNRRRRQRAAFFLTSGLQLLDIWSKENS